MSLTYIEKLKIFHDNFVKYTWNYIERQKAMENGQEVPAMTTPFKDNLTPLKVLPIVKDTVEVVSWLNDIWNGHLHHITSINVNRLFALSDRMTQQMLSRAIQEVAIHIEDHLNTLSTPQEIGAFATTAMIKFISYIRSNHYNDIETLTSNDIIFAILQQKLFSNDVFKAKIIEQSDNYYFIYEKEIRNDITAGKIDNVKQALVPVSIEFDYSMEEINIISSISADNAVSLCEYIRMNNKISPDKQIVIIQDSVQKDHMFPRYTIISPSVIDSEIDSLRIDDLEDMVANNQDNIGKQEAMLLRHGIILDEHEELFQQIKQIKQNLENEQNMQLYLQSLQEYSTSSNQELKTKTHKTTKKKVTNFIKKFSGNVDELLDLSTKSKKNKKHKSNEENKKINDKLELENTKKQLDKAEEDLQSFKMQFEEFKNFICESGVTNCNLMSGMLMPEVDTEL